MKNIMATLTLSLAAMNAIAASEPIILNTSADSVRMALSFGRLQGQSEELVYHPVSGDKISQLSWKIRHAAIVNGNLDWDAFSRLTVSAAGWTTVNGGKGYMTDRDWNERGQSAPTDQSWHPITLLNYASQFELNIKGWLLKGADYRVGPIIGYQQTRFSWTSFGGHYRYGNIRGDWPEGLRSIGYQQTFAAPYIGLAAQYRLHNIEVNSLVKYSNRVKAKDNDEHYLRELTFRDRSGGSDYYSAMVNAGYSLTSQIKIYSEVSYNRYTQGRGGTEIIDNSSGQSWHHSGPVAGISNENYMALVGLQYHF